jgi:hypothetical protein
MSSKNKKECKKRKLFLSEVKEGSLTRGVLN